MGVPAFYRWLSERYPKIIVDMIEAKPVDPDVPLDTTTPNPNSIEFDNLYVDMNGIIHPCSHPEDRPPPRNEEEMFRNVCYYVDRLFAAVRPRKLLFLAIDGVAPRAKMNQQRSRRFKSVKEMREGQEAMEEVRQDMMAMGLKVPPKAKPGWDSNVITPGTQFMDKLAIFLRYYILDRCNKNPAWKNIKVVFSDANEPGEGEHKIMNYIRAQRSHAGYEPNQKHVIHGLDADLIMLALATHEADFTILREQVLFGRAKREDAERRQKAKQEGYDALKGIDPTLDLPNSHLLTMKPLQMLRVPVLREYLRIEFQALSMPGALPFPYDFERVVDDFVFLCFFVGNDFLPHLPSLDIRDGALLFLFDTYRRLLPAIGGFLTSEGGEVNLRGVDVILAEVGKVEDELFRRKHAQEQNIRRREATKKMVKKMGGAEGEANKQHLMSNNLIAPVKGRGNFAAPAPAPAAPVKTESSAQENISAAEKLRQMMNKRKVKAEVSEAAPAAAPPAKKVKKEEDNGKDEAEAKAPPVTSTGLKGDAEEDDEDEDEEELVSEEVEKTLTVVEDGDEKDAVTAAFKERVKMRAKEKMDRLQRELEHSDKVRLHEAGWRDRYYMDKYHDEPDIAAPGGPGRKRIFKAYVEGLCWVMAYYYRGCASWSWFYPFHYAP
eukprot:CAMPEP_0118859926 /NCGR_PEP_ID=MMETSP1163-20130328/5958_1 /TAXON_ID=124430 /ORGANISM="Phaeomonas parva, Strain CCMP2877" /LENGTH=661 /DNA_ID=CAMNT_0006793567 /DNA_START=21 /DNA_END=2002 /DNA_ORIENTATION=+